MLATRGTSQRISFEAAVPGGDLDYYKLGYNAETYKGLTRHLTLKLRTNLGYANSYRSDRDLPFFEHYMRAVSARCAVLNATASGRARRWQRSPLWRNMPGMTAMAMVCPSRARWRVPSFCVRIPAN